MTKSRLKDEFDARLLIFEEWCKQFSDDADLEEFLPEFGMTLRDFRKSIFESERSGWMTYEALGAAIQQWKKE